METTSMKLVTPIVPRSTQQELANPAAPGSRHDQMVKIACSLASQKFAAAAIHAQLRSMYGEDVSDVEIGRVVDWAVAQDYKPLYRPARFGRPFRRRQSWRTPSDPRSLVERFLQSFTCSQADLSKASPVKIHEDHDLQCILAIRHLYEPHENINIVVEHRTEQSTTGKLKANPAGYGRTKTRDEWLARVENAGIPQSPAGVWLRMNPVDGQGIEDSNITAFRYYLIESDSLPTELQLSFLAKLRLPIAMIVSSGGRSFHAWVKLDAVASDEYRTVVAKISKRLTSFGVDGSNKNPGRLSRLPGARREIGAAGDGWQRLIYLNPSPTGTSIL